MVSSLNKFLLGSILHWSQPPTVTKAVEKYQVSGEHLARKSNKLLYDTSYAYHPHNNNKHTVGKFKDFLIR